MIKDKRRVRKKRYKKIGMNKRQRIIITTCLAVILLLIVGVFAGVYIYESNSIYSSRQFEVGTEISVNDFLKKANKDAYFTEDSDSFDTKVPGIYHLVVKVGMFHHKCDLYIKDTIAPIAEPQAVQIYYGEKCEASNFVKNIVDKTKTSVSFVNEPNYETTQKQNITVKVTDSGNNTITVDSELIISNVRPKISIEAGHMAPEISEYVIKAQNAKFLRNISEIDFNKAGSYSIAIEVDGIQYEVYLDVVDTSPPELEVKNLSGFLGYMLEPKSFVTTSYDVTGDVTFTYEKEPDYNHEGIQNVVIVAMDIAGNQTKKEAQLTLVKDTEPPIIKGAADMNTWVGGIVTYKKMINISDNSGSEAKLTIDSSAVNLNSEGVYPVSYTATDGAGNKTTVTINLTVEKRVYTQEKLNIVVDNALKSIFGMNSDKIPTSVSKYDTVKGIYDYIRSHISFVDTSDKSDWVKAAYEGITSGHGDCFTYASVAKAFLTRAGIKNMDIARIPEGDELHYWNIVDIEDGHGWYHYDTTPRKDRPYIFLWDDAKITTYSNSHSKCHNYDRNLYPVIP